jgi:hypothetical protein
VAALKFEHVVVVSDPANPLITDLSRSQLWAGLMARVEDPCPFLPGLERCAVVECEALWRVRDLYFGAVVIRDRVTLEPMQSVTFVSERTEEHAGGSLTISIEEPEPQVLVLRFEYSTTLSDAECDPDGAYASYVQSAYFESDIDTVRVIRELAARAQPQ